MQVQLLAFAQAHDQLGFRERLVDCTPTDTPRGILQRLAPTAALDTMRVAVDREYADWDAPIGGDAREIALIPPVSGG
jgi:molybdopterin converting factor small subunit